MQESKAHNVKSIYAQVLLPCLEIKKDESLIPSPTLLSPEYQSKFILMSGAHPIPEECLLKTQFQNGRKSMFLINF